MKKLLSTLLVVALAVAMSVVAFGCNNTTDPVKVGRANAYALVHGQGYMGSVTAVVDSESKVQYVQINEYFLPSTWANAAIKPTKKADAPGATFANDAAKNDFMIANAVANTAGSANSGTLFADTVKVVTVSTPALKSGSTTEYEATVTTNYWAKYIRIADKYFQATFTGSPIATTNVGDCYTAAPVYKQIGVTSGGIADLGAYLRPSGATFASTLNTDASKWYGEAVEKGEAWVLQSTTDAVSTTGVLGVVSIKDASNADVKLKYNSKAVGASGGINKRFASYGNDGYSWMKSILIIEDYIYANGFAFVADDIAGIKTSTGATATDTADYMLLAKSACELAKAKA